MYKTTMKDVYECVERLGKYYVVYSADTTLYGYCIDDNYLRSIWNCGFDGDDLADILEATALNIEGEFDEDDYDNCLIHSDFIDFIGGYIVNNNINYFEVGLYALKEVDLYDGNTCEFSGESFEAIRMFFADIMKQIVDLCLDRTEFRADEEVTFNLEVPYVFESKTAKALMEDFQEYVNYDEDSYGAAFKEIENSAGEYSSATKRCIVSMFNNVMYQYDDTHNDIYMCVNTITDELDNEDFYEDNNCAVIKEKEIEM